MEETYKILLDRISSFTVLVNYKGVILHCNKAFATFVDLRSADEAVSKNLTDVLPFSTEEVHALKDVIQSVAVSNKAVADATVEYHLHRQEKTIQLVRKIFPVPMGQGGSRNICLVFEILSDGNPGLICGTEESLGEIEKKVALGNLLRGFSHEVKTPLSAIFCNLDLMARCIKKLGGLFSGEEEERFLAAHKEISKQMDILNESMEVNQIAGKQVMQRIQSLKEIVGVDEERESELDLKEVLDSAIVLIHHLTRDRIQIRLDYGDTPNITANSGKLSQVFLNILINAIEAIHEKGAITISTGLKNEQVFVSITDTGEGIPPEHLKQLFNQGFTTKKCGGTGLGLFISNNIIRERGGHIEVESRLEEGTTFRIVFPAGKKSG